MGEVCVSCNTPLTEEDLKKAKLLGDCPECGEKYTNQDDEKQDRGEADAPESEGSK